MSEVNIMNENIFYLTREYFKKGWTQRNIYHYLFFIVFFFLLINVDLVVTGEYCLNKLFKIY